MKKLNHRRRFLKGALVAGVLSPLATRIFNPVQAATNAPKRAIFFYMPDGINPPDWHATGTGTNFNLPGMTQPLNDVKQHCVFLSGVDMMGGAGVHPGGLQKAITANDSDSAATFKATNATSLDFYLGQQIGADTPFRNVHLNVMATQRSPFFLQGSQVLGAKDANTGFANYIGSLLPNQGKQRNQLVVDNVLAEMNQLKKDLGSLEQDKLDVHMDGLYDLEKRLNGEELSCNYSDFEANLNAPIDAGLSTDLGSGNSPFEIQLNLQIDLLVKLLECDIARVFSLQVSQYFGQIKFKDADMVQHASSHFGATEKRSTHLPWFIKNRQLYTNGFKRLINKLNAIDEGERTALGNSMALFFSELGQSYNHQHSNAPFILAGNAGGAITTGRALAFNNQDHSRLLVSMAQAMDVNTNTFGSRNVTGGLPGL